MYDWKTTPKEEMLERFLKALATEEGRQHIYRFTLARKVRDCLDWEPHVAHFFGHLDVPPETDKEAIERLWHEVKSGLAAPESA